MPQLLLTSTTNDHLHVALVLDDGSGMTSNDAQHVHEVIAGALVSTDHTHELLPLPPALPVDPRPPALTPDNTTGVADSSSPEARILAEATKIYKAMIERERTSKAEATTSREFRTGKQWTDEQIATLDAEARAHVVINYTGAMVDLFSGYARQNRRDPRAYPVEGGDQAVCDLINLALKQISNQTGFDVEEIRVFEDGIVDGRGVFRLWLDYSQDVRGVIRVTRVNNLKATFGGHKNLDATDAECASVEEWLSLERLKQLYPKSASKLDKLAAALTNVSVHTALEQLHATDWGAEILGNLSDPTFTDPTTRTFKLIELERLEYRTAHTIVGQDGTIFGEVKPEHARRAATIPGLLDVTSPRSRLRRTIFVGSLLLDDLYPDLPFDGLSLVPFYVYLNDDGTYYGKIRAAIDPQREVNKRHSQAIDIVNKCAGYGRLYDSNTFDDNREEENYRRHGGKPGYVGRVRDAARPPVNLEGTKVPAEVLQLEEVGIEQFYRAVNVSPQLFGAMESANESGRVVQIRQRAALLGNEFIFDNFTLAKRGLWRRVLKMVQRYYTPDRLTRLVTAAAAREQQPLNVGASQLNPGDPQVMAAIQTLFSTLDLLDYDVVMAEGPMSPTTMETERMLWTEFSQYNPGVVPPELIVQLSNLAHKPQWAAIMAQNAQAQAQAAAAKAQTDIIKAGRAPVPGGATPGQPPTGGPR